MEPGRRLAELLGPLGLCELGRAQTKEDGALILVGNAGSAMWTVFRSSPEFADDLPNPLDRWTRRVGEAVATELGAGVVFPFDGPPYPPFLRWSADSGRAFRSPLSMLLHADFGLWHAYRFALCLDEVTGVTPHGPRVSSPCESCPDQPCLSACPNGAFTSNGYELEACTEELRGADRGDCIEKACAARRACPVARAFRYDSAHAAFHMRAFLATHAPPAEAVDQGLLEKMP